MATITWTGAAKDGSFATAGNWSPAQVPGAGDDAVIAIPAIVTAPGNRTVNSLTTSSGVTLLATGDLIVLNAVAPAAGATGVNAGTLRASGGGTLQVSGTEVHGTLDAGTGTLALSAATIQGGTIAATGGGIIQVGGSVTLDGTAAPEALLAGAVVSVGNGQTLSVLGTLASAGEITFAPYNGTATLLVAGATSLTGTGTVVLAPGSYAGSEVTAAAAADTLTNVGETIEGTGQLGAGLLGLVNDALVDANASGQTLELNTGTLATANAGTLEASSGGVLQLDDRVNNTGTIAALTGGTVTLAGAYVAGGTLLSDAASGIVAGTATLDGSSAAVSLTGLLAVANGQTLTLLGSIVDAGTLTTTPYNGDTTFLVGAATTLTGRGAVTLVQGSYATSNIIGSGTAALTNAAATIQGTGRLGGGNLAFTNQALVDANNSGQTLDLNAGTFTTINTGTLEATSGGTLQIDTAVDDRGGTIAAAGGTVVLNGTTVEGGLLASSAGGSIAVNTSTLDGTTQGSLTSTGLLVLQNGQTVTLLGSIVNAGTITAVPYNGDTTLLVGSATTLTGSGTVTLVQGSYSTSNILGSGTASLTSVDNTIQGAGRLGDGNLAFTNRSLVDANDAGLTLELNTGTLATTNTGTLEATGTGLLQIDDTVVDAGGTIAAAGGTVVLNGAIIEGGLLASSAGGSIAVNTSTLDGTTQGSLTSTGLLVLQNGQTVTLLGSIVNAGTITAVPYNGDTTLLVGSATTLTGGGTITMVQGSYASTNILGSGGATLTNADNTIQGVGRLGDGNLAFTNRALVDANTSGLTLELNTGTLATTSTGTLEATNGGTLQIDTLVADAGGTIAAAGGTVLLDGARIEGGSLSSTGTGMVALNGPATLDGTTDGTLATSAQLVLQNGETLTLLGSIANSGTITATPYNGDTTLLVGGATTLTGGGTITLVQGSYATTNITGSGTAALVNAGNTIQGAGRLGDGNLAFTNQALVDANDAGLTLELNTGTLAASSTGTLEATNGGTLQIDTTLDNAGGLVSAAGGTVLLDGGTIAGGTLSSTGTNLVMVSGNATLDGASDGPLATSAQVLVGNGQSLTLLGSVANTGTIAFAPYNGIPVLVAGSATTTLSGNGAVVLSQGSYAASEIVGAAAANGLENAGNTISGQGSMLVASLLNDAPGIIDATGTIVIDPGAAGSVVNRGLVEATTGTLDAATGTLSGIGTLSINEGTFTNTGTLDADGGMVVVGTAVTYGASGGDVAGTLTGGTWEAQTLILGTNTAAGTLTLDGAPVVVDAASIVLDGAGSELVSGIPPLGVTIESTLGSIAAGGTLSLLDGRGYAVATAGGLLANAGHIVLGGGTVTDTLLANSGTIAGTGTLAGRVANTGLILAQPGTLTVAQAISGSLAIAGGATLVLGAGDTGGTVAFGAAHAELVLDAPSAFAGTLGGLVPSDGIALEGVSATAASISGSSLLVTLTGGTTLTYALSGAAAGDRPAISALPGNAGTQVTIYREAGATEAPSPVAFAQQHVGGTLSTALTLTNTATADGYSETLDAAVSPAGGISTSGSVTHLAAGASDGSDLRVALDTSSPGSATGIATIALSSDGSGVDANPAIADGSIAVPVSGQVFAYATVSALATLSLGNQHVGTTASASFPIGNVTPGVQFPNVSYTEALDASIVGTGGDATATGSVTLLRPGAVSGGATQGLGGGGIDVGLGSGAEGVQSGTVSIAYVSDGSLVDTLAATGLGTRSVTVTGTFYALATPSLGSTSLDLGAARVGGTLAATDTLANGSTADPYREALGYDLSDAGSVAVTGSGTVVAGNTATLALGLATATSGTVTGSTQVTLFSLPGGFALQSTALGTDTVSLTGTVYQAAGASLGTTAISFGTIHVGDTGTAALAVGNTATGALVDSVTGGFAAVSAPFGGSGSLAVAAGGTGTLALSLAGTAAGSYAGTATLALDSHDPALPDLALATSTVTLTGTVDAYASPALELTSGNASLSGTGTAYTLDLGTLAVGSGADTVGLGVLNAAGGVADTLAGSFTEAGSTAYANAGFAAFSGVAAGGADTAPRLTLDTSAAGTFTETIVLAPQSVNASSTTALATETLTVTGVVQSVPCYVTGTRILTARGEVAVEALRVGDRAVALLGQGLARVRWIGERTLDLRAHPDPRAVRPVRISAGAFGEGRPLRDLCVSPGHALYVDGVLVQAERLLNGVSIRQEAPDSVTYWHVELERHDVLLAEGLPAESYLDTGNRTAFRDGGAFLQLHPDFRPRHWAQTCAPLVQEGPVLEAVKARLLERAAAAFGARTTHDPGLHVLADGVAIAPDSDGEGGHRFELPPHARSLQLASRRWVPAQMLSASTDTRELGVCVRRLEADGVALDLADARLAAGWDKPEADAGGTLRWTRGLASLPEGIRTLTVRLDGFALFPVHGGDAGVAPMARGGIAASARTGSVPTARGGMAGMP